MKVAFSFRFEGRRGRTWEGRVFLCRELLVEVFGSFLFMESGWRLGWVVKKGLWVLSGFVVFGDWEFFLVFSF